MLSPRGSADKGPMTPRRSVRPGANEKSTPRVSITRVDSTDVAERSLAASQVQKISVSEWQGRALHDNPDALELYERLRPLTNASSFGRLFLPGRTEAKVINHEAVLYLIAGYLKEHGLENSIEKLSIESGIDLRSGNYKDDLRYLLQTGITEAKSIFSATLLEDMKADEAEEDGDVPQFDYQPPMLEKKDRSFESWKQINVWDEPEDDASFIIETDGSNQRIKLATFNKLIQFITSDQLLDLQVREVFLATFCIYATPQELFHKLMERYVIPEKIPKDDANIKKIRLHIVRLIKSWLTKQPKDFNESLVEDVVQFVDVTLVNDGHKDLANTLRKTLSELPRLLEKDQEEDTQTYIDLMEHSPDPKVPKNLFSPLLALTDIHPEEISRQITLIDFQLFSNITLPELMTRNWNDPKYANVSNVSAWRRRFNLVARWVSAEILKKRNPKDRAEMVGFFIRIAEHLRMLQSFNSLFAIMAGMQHLSIARLTHTFNALQSTLKQSLSLLIDFTSTKENFLNYRVDITHRKPPLIPFCGCELQDILLLQENFPDHVGRRINFEKLTNLHNKAHKFILNNSLRYQFLPVMQISQFLTKFPKLMDQKEMMAQSYILEPQGISATQLEILHPRSP